MTQLLSSSFCCAFFIVLTLPLNYNEKMMKLESNAQVNPDTKRAFIPLKRPEAKTLKKLQYYVYKPFTSPRVRIRQSTSLRHRFSTTDQ